MEFPVTLRDLAGSVALLLWGVQVWSRPVCSGLSEQNFEASWVARCETVEGLFCRNRCDRPVAE